MNFPDFLIIGAEKAGTTWLHDRLDEHPATCLPEVKEIHYFNRFDSNLNETDNFTRRGESWYLSHFKDTPAGHLRGEATPMYLCDPDAADRIKTTVPEARIIISLRNPVTRAYSHFQMARAKGHLSKSLEQVLADKEPRILERGLYADQVARWQNIWPAERLKVLFFEDLIGPNSRDVLQEVCHFLQIDPAVYADHDTSGGNKNAAAEYRSTGVYNWGVSGARALRNFGPTRGLANALKASGLYDMVKKANRKEGAYAQLPDAARAQLVDYYAPDVARLKDVLGVPLPWPDFD